MYKVNRGQAPKYISDVISTVRLLQQHHDLVRALGKLYELLSAKAPDQVRRASFFTLCTGSMEQAPTWHSCITLSERF